MCLTAFSALALPLPGSVTIRLSYSLPDPSGRLDALPTVPALGPGPSARRRRRRRRRGRGGSPGRRRKGRVALGGRVQPGLIRLAPSRPVIRPARLEQGPAHRPA